jgi:hypothetical protein
VSVLAISARERRTITIGLAVSLLALFIVFAVLPYARRLQTREQLIAAESNRLARLRGLISGEARLRDAVSERTGALAAGDQRLLAGRTPALVASTLQALLQDYANQSQVTVSRLDVTGESTSSGGVPMMPATVSAIGDIYGISQMLYLIQHGPRLLEIAEFTVRPNPALRGELLQITVTLRGAYVNEAAP